jgi:hypothetical protein
VQGLYRFFGPRLGAQEFTKFKEFFNATFPTLQVHALSPNEGDTFDIGLPTSLLGCNGPTVDSDIAWRSSLVSPVTGTNAVGNGCLIPADKLARGTQYLTAYRTTDPRRKSTVKVTIMKSEATLTMSQTGQFVLPAGSNFLDVTLNWTSQDVGTQLFVTEQLDNDAEMIRSELLSGSLVTRVNVNRQGIYRIRAGNPTGALTGRILNEKSVLVLAAPLLPVVTPTKVTYPFQEFSLFKNDCPNAECTFVVRWLADSSFGVTNDIQVSRLIDCNGGCSYGPWQALATSVTGSSRVVYFTQRLGIDGFRFRVRSCAPLRGCSGWSNSPTTFSDTLYQGRTTISPNSAMWFASSNGSCDEIPITQQPMLTMSHDYPLPFTKFILYESVRAAKILPLLNPVPPGTSQVKLLSASRVGPAAGLFGLAFGFASLQLTLTESVTSDGRISCGYSAQ